MFLRALRALAHTAAGVWLGGMIVIAIVAQTTFGVMRTTQVDQPNIVAGEVMAANFVRFDRVQLVCAAVLVLWQAAALLFERRSVRDLFRAGAIAAAAGLFLYSSQALTPMILDMQTTLAAADPEEAARAIFESFHQTAVRIAQVNLVLMLFVTMEMSLPRWSPGHTKLERV